MDKNSSAPFLDLGRWWGHAKDLPSETRLTALLERAGVQFHESGLTPHHPDYRFVRAPSASVVGVGGIPIDIDDEGRPGLYQMPRQPDFKSWLMDAQRQSMGFASAMTYLNPNDVGALELHARAVERGHFSVTHTASLTLLVAGFSVAVENELNGQRDLVHLSRLTVARTTAQTAPPLCVLHSDDLEMYRDIHQRVGTWKVDGAFIGPAGEYAVGRFARLEAMNLVYPAAKATMVLLTGSLRSLQKLIYALDDYGREEEYKRVLREINSALFLIHPDLFLSSDTYQFRPTYRRGT